jgi:HAD superfamily hydrolase (TIGR01509 family)
MKKGIITDLSGVVWEDAFADIGKYADMFGADPERLGAAKDRVWVERFSLDPGMAYREFWMKVFGEAGVGLSDKEIDYVNRSLLKAHRPHRKLLSFYKTLKASGIPVVAITNSCRDWLEWWKERYGLDEAFGSIVASYACGVRKPETALWKIAIRETGLPPKGLAAVEDQYRNLRGARRAGIPEENCIVAADEGQVIHSVEEFLYGPRETTYSRWNSKTSPRTKGLLHD